MGLNASKQPVLIMRHLLYKCVGTIAEELHPAVEELMLTEAGAAYEVVSKCHLEMELSHANKGVEGIQYYDAGDKGVPPVP